MTAFAPPAAADHTDPRTQIVPADEGFPGEPVIARGEGTWHFIRNFPAAAGNVLLGSGTDHKVFAVGDRVYASVGTLGQGNELHIGQRIVLLADGNRVSPAWIADHGSAACPPANASITGLQHDVALAGRVSRGSLAGIDDLAAPSLAVNPEILIDTTDAAGRCHDPGGGGLELIDVTEIDDPKFKPREIHLVRLAGFSHTVTVDEQRPWIVYNSSADFMGRPWIDVVDVRSCLGLRGLSLNQKRDRCRPQVYRIPFNLTWSRQRDVNERLVPGSEAACHDITARDGRIYCAALNATLIIDVRRLTTPDGGVRGDPLSCARINGTTTAASVTDCGSVEGPTRANRVPRALGWRFLGTFNHPGRSDGTGRTTGNTNVEVPSNEGVAVSHEADPTPDHRWMFVTDERGGGVIPPGASCVPGAANPIGNGGIHVFDIRDPANIKYARTPNGEKAIWFGEVVAPAVSFCTVHVIEQVPREQRLTVAYYTQGTKILDYFIDKKSRWTFRETASLVLPGANTWASDVFKIKDNPNGTKTYYFIASDIGRGIDIFSWTGRPNALGTPPPPSGSAMSMSVAVVGAVFLGLVLPVAAGLGRRRRAL